MSKNNFSQYLEDRRRRHRARYERHLETQEQHSRYHRHYEEVRRYHQYFKFFGPVILLVNIIIFYLLFKDIGIKTISIFIGLFLVFKEIMQFIFYQRIEKRILAPVAQLIQGVEAITHGNYAVQVNGEVPNNIGSLISAFNEMARKLQESESSKTEFEENRKALIANISHDLKTPITSMQGYLEVLLEGMVSSPEKVELYLKTIYHNTVYTNKLIDDLFLFTKLDMQKLDFHFEEVQLRPFMKDLFEEFRFELEERECQFKYTASLAEDLRIVVDGKRIHQAVRNIIGNAVKHGPVMGLAITAKLYQQDQFLYIDITDNGIGIPSDKLPYIFDRFYRIDHERTKDLMSTGLGLAIAKELIEAHGGRITVASVEGEGACFTLMLPITEQQERAEK